MKKHLSQHFENQLHHLYINPLEKCNLRCKICYTKKTDFILTEEQIIHFIEEYNSKIRVETVTICGGEVFTLPYFPSLINSLNSKGIFTQIITNGIIDRLSEIANPNKVNLIFSLDGLEIFHDKNRGEGNFKKSFSLLKKAICLGFHTEIFSIVTRQNLKYINKFETMLEKKLGVKINVTYHPRKPGAYLKNHPISNIKGAIRGFDYLKNEEIIKLMNEKNTFPPKRLGCFQVSLMSEGNVYACCEGTIPIGNINSEIKTVIENLESGLEKFDKSHRAGKCLGCAYPEFMCGMRRIFCK